VLGAIAFLDPGDRSTLIAGDGLDIEAEPLRAFRRVLLPDELGWHVARLIRMDAPCSCDTHRSSARGHEHGGRFWDGIIARRLPLLHELHDGMGKGAESGARQAV
jgi:hypothetical protein